MELEVKMKRKLLLILSLLCVLPMQANYFSRASKWFGAAVRRVKKSWYKKDTKNTQTLFKQNNINNIGSNLFAKNGFQLNSRGSIFSGMPNLQKQSTLFKNILPQTNYQKMVNALTGKKQSNGNDSNQNNSYNGFNAKTAFTLGALGATAGYFLTKDDEQNKVDAKGCGCGKYGSSCNGVGKKYEQLRELMAITSKNRPKAVKECSVDDICSMFQKEIKPEVYSKMCRSIDACTEKEIDVLVQSAKTNFTHLIKNRYGYWLISRIISMKPSIAPLFVSCLKSNLLRLAESNHGHCWLTKILDIDAKIALEVALIAKQSFNELIKKEYGIRICLSMLEKCPECAIYFLEPVSDNIQMLAGTWAGVDLIVALSKQNAECTEKLLYSIFQNFAIFWQQSRSFNILKGMIKANDRLGDQLIEKFAQNLDLLAESNSGFWIVNTIMKKNSKAVARFTQVILQDFAKLCKKDYVCLIIRKILALNPKSIKAFVEPIAKNLGLLAKSRSAADLVLDVMKKQPDVAVKFAQVINQNFAEIVKVGYGPKIIEEIIKVNPQVVEQFAQPAMDNIQELGGTWSGFRVIKSILENSSQEAVQECAQKVVQNFAEIVKVGYGPKIIEEIIKVNPEAAELFAQPAMDNILELGQTRRGFWVIKSILENSSQEAAQAYTEKVIKNFDEMVKIYGFGIIQVVIEVNFQAADRLVPMVVGLILENDKTGLLFWFIMKFLNDCSQGVAQLLSQEVIKNFSAFMELPFGQKYVKEIIEKMGDSTEILDIFEKLATECDALNILSFITSLRAQATFRQGSTQTQQHFKSLLEHNRKKLKRFMPKVGTVEYNRFDLMNKKLIASEKQQQQAGRYTFVHGYPWQYHFLHDLYSELWSVVHAQKLNDYMFLRFIADMHDGSGKKGNEAREEILKNGVGRYYASVSGKQKHMLFMNYALLCNQNGSNTLQYIFNNNCENPVELHVKTMFRHLGLARLGLDLAKYKEDIAELERLHKEANKFGAGLMLSFTPEMLKKSVYVCKGGGGKKKVYIKGIGKTDDVQLILDTLRKAPEKIKSIDHMEFVHILTKDCALNPEVIKSGAIKIIPFNPADPEKLAQYKKALALFIAKVKRDLQQEREVMTNREFEEQQSDLRYFKSVCKEYNCLNEDNCPSRLIEK